MAENSRRKSGILIIGFMMVLLALAIMVQTSASQTDLFSPAIPSSIDEVNGQLPKQRIPFNHHSCILDDLKKLCLLHSRNPLRFGHCAEDVAAYCMAVKE
ncbi:hypothetical protein L484_004914 [Morus notabilis]|uniref:Prolamin-like domain-containing protein n=1 Tax=Morus notabilis TaxID=981085 RepID=W9RBV2_9ROSA|nr:hypothetical protein L484_004914 [Morus notabilis]